MKRTLLNIAIWLLAALLCFVLLKVLHSDPTNQTPSITAAHTSEMAAMFQEKQRIEAELQRLSHEYKSACAAPTSVFIMIHSPEEDILQEATSLLNQLNLPGILGVSGNMLTQWESDGLPSLIQKQLDAGWELCLLLEETPPQEMQKKLSALHLNTAIAAYDTPANILTLTSEELLDCGIRILIEDDLSIANEDDGLWHIGSIGNMHSDGIRIYEQYRNTGSAFVNVIGHYRADQIYVKENLEGLLELLLEDSRLGLVHCVRLPNAMQYHELIAQRLAEIEQEWIQTRTDLERELQSVIDQITTASSLLNQ